MCLAHNVRLLTKSLPIECTEELLNFFLAPIESIGWLLNDEGNRGVIAAKHGDTFRRKTTRTVVLEAGCKLLDADKVLIVVLVLGGGRCLDLQDEST